MGVAMSVKGPARRKTCDGVNPYDSSVAMKTAKFEAPLCRMCIFDECQPGRFGCQVAIATRKKANRAMPGRLVWRGEEHTRIADLAEVSGANYERLRYHLSRCATAAEAVVKAGGEKE